MQNVTDERWRYIGGSDIPCIMGISPFKSRWQLLQEKAQLADSDFDGNEYTEYGNIMEPKIRDYVNEKYSKNFVEHKLINGVFRCHTDGYDPETKMILEIKTTSQIHDDIVGYKQYLVQLIFYMMCYKSDCGMLAVYERPEDFSLEPGDQSLEFDSLRLTVFGVTASEYEQLCGEIEFQVDRFLDDLEKLRENPFLTEEELQPFEIVAISDSVIKLEERLIAYKEIEKAYKAEKAELKSAMEKYGIKQWTTSSGAKITLVPDGTAKPVREFDLISFAEENPKLHEKYMVNKIKPGKAGYVRITL